MHWVVLLVEELLWVGWPSRQYQQHISSVLTSSVSSSTVRSPGNDDWTTPYESSVYDADTRWDRPTDRQTDVMLCWLTQQKNCGLSYVVIYKVEYLYVCLLPIISAPLQSTLHVIHYLCSGHSFTLIICWEVPLWSKLQSKIINNRKLSYRSSRLLQPCYKNKQKEQIQTQNK